MKKYTREEKIVNRKNNKIIGIISSVFVGMFLCATAYFIYNLLKLSNIENVLRYIGIGILIIVSLLVVRFNFSLRSQSKKYKFIILILLLIVFGVVEYFAGSFISKAISTLDTMNKDTVKYTSKLIALKEGETTKKNISNKKIGIISDEDDIEGYILAQEIIKKQDISLDNVYDYDEDIVMIKALYSGEIDACFVANNYIERYKNRSDFENIEDETKVLFKYSKEMKKKSSKKGSKKKTNITEPFSILVLGVDSVDEDISEAWGLGDTTMLVTFNPKTLTATAFSIPRDTYLPISCAGNSLSKITHAAPYGDECVKKTVENFTGIKIDYTAKVNFRGMIKLVDALGGIDVNVPYAICESNENRNFTEVITLEAGYQHLDGKQALALARNRKVYDWCGEHYAQGERNDFVRGQNQQLVIEGIMNAAKNIRSVDQFYQVLDAVGQSLDTDLSREQMLDFYNVFKDVFLSTDSLTDANDIISMQKTYLNGSDGHLYDYLAGAELYEFLPSYNSLNAITKAMKINLEMEEEKYDTSFTFSIDEPYEPKVIGKDVYGGVKNYPQPEKKNETKTCGTNEELGADGQTCVCKSGYKKDSKGICKKSDEDDTETDVSCTNATVVEGKCVCWKGYEDPDGDNVCTAKQEESSGGSESGNSGESGGSESGGESSGGSGSGGGSDESGGGSESGDSGEEN